MRPTRRPRLGQAVSVVAVSVLIVGIGASGLFAYQRLDAAAPESSSDQASDSDTADATGDGTDDATVDGVSEEPPVADSDQDSGTETGAATIVDLVDEDEVSGQLGYGDSTEVVGHGGVITRLPEAGAVLELGDTAWDVDGAAGPAVIYGGLPQWRRLDRNSDDGADILQLEYNLAMLGFGADMTVDDEFDSATREAVRDWQESRGLERTGVVEIGDVVIVPDPVRVDELVATIGAEADGPVLKITDVEQIVTMAADMDEIDLFAVGDDVLIELPDDRRVPGTVTEIAKTATADQDGNVTIEIGVALDEPEPSLVAAPVEVIVQRTRADDALVVPIRSLLALAEGGYAVEKIVAGGTTLVGVELGEFGDGVVQITAGDIAAGDTVVVAP